MTTPSDLLNTLPSVKGERRQRVTSNNDMLEELERMTSEKVLSVVTKPMTTTDNASGDGCIKYYKVTTEEHFMERGFKRHTGRTFQTYVADIPPRKFYEETTLRAFMSVTERRAGRTIEDAEWALLLRAITNGRHYKLTCVYDVTEDLEGVTVYDDIKQ